MANKNQLTVAIVGASGMAGRELINILEESSLKIRELSLFASKNSAGERLVFLDEEIIVNELKDEQDINADVVFFAAGSEVSLSYAPKLAARGIVCIDKSSAFRKVSHLPLVASGVNDDVIAKDIRKTGGIVASPNCVAVPLVQVLKPISNEWGLQKVVVSTYQAVSGAGKEGFDELETQVRDLFNMREIKSPVFKERIAFNILPWIPAHGKPTNDRYSDEEDKLMDETKKILADEKLAIDATCVRAPLFNGHSLSVYVETQRQVDCEQVKSMLAKTPNIVVKDHPEEGIYPTPVDASGKNSTFVGRIRQSRATRHGVSLWISSDNLRTGAALNAVRIAEHIFGE